MLNYINTPFLASIAGGISSFPQDIFFALPGNNAIKVDDKIAK